MTEVAALVHDATTAQPRNYLLSVEIKIVNVNTDKSGKAVEVLGAR